MRLLIVNGSDITQIGGVNNSIRKVTRILAEKGHEITVVSLNPGELPAEEMINGVKVRRAEKKASPHLYDFSPGLNSIVKDTLDKVSKPDIVHIHGYNTLLSHEVAFLLRKRKARYVFSPHYSPLAHRRRGAGILSFFGRPLGKFVYEGAARIVCMSQYEAELVSRHFQLPGEKTVVIPNGVDKIELERKRVARQGQTQEICLLYVGYVIKLKGIQFILRSLAELTIERGRNARLIVVGRGDYEGELRRLAVKLGVDNLITWLGILTGDDLQGIYHKSDVLLLLSVSENFGTVVAEALSSGLPAIVTTNTALQEFTQEPGCLGVSYPPDPRAVADAIQKIVESRISTGSPGAKIRTWTRIAEDYEHLYQEILEESTNP